MLKCAIDCVLCFGFLYFLCIFAMAVCLFGFLGRQRTGAKEIPFFRLWLIRLT